MAGNAVEAEEEESSVTMLDVLLEENQLEEDAHAVLGASDDKNCTYLKGYIRQALYACKTCTFGKTRAAVCLACSFHCHEGHELIELYTKRHIRCDCGNVKFGDRKCHLEPSKLSINKENKYNQNFDGVYCICARPYPDPDGTNDDVMLQCAICEDWYHSKHLERDEGLPADDAYEEMVCMACMKKHNFLWKYVAKYGVFMSKSSIIPSKDAIQTLDIENHSKDECTMPTKEITKKTGSCFWAEGWRSFLCTCEKCKMLYEEKEIAFLLDPKDSVSAYEAASEINKRESQYEKGMKALASLDHVQQLTAIEGYNNMKERLKEYLRKFADNKKVVREEDIKEFFSEMESKKRRKVIVPTYCR